MQRVIRIGLDLTVSIALIGALVVVGWLDEAALSLEEDSVPPPRIVTEETTEVTDLIPEFPKIAVTPAQFDDMGRLLTELGEGYDFREIDETQLSEPEALAEWDTLFLTCAEETVAANATQGRAAAALRRFVRDGGTLYASDLRFDLLAEAFPEFVDHPTVAQGKKQNIDAVVVESGLREVLGPRMPLHFDLDGWRPAAFAGPDVRVLLAGKLQTTAGVEIEAPLLVEFPFGTGSVVFTSFHNERQHSENERKLLKFLVLKTVTAKLQSTMTRTLVSGGFSPQQQNLLSAAESNDSVSHTYRHERTGDLRFALGFDTLGARLRLTVQGPNGLRYDQQGESSFVIDVTSAPPGDWTYMISAQKVPYRNFPFTLTVGATSSEILSNKELRPKKASLSMDKPRWPNDGSAAKVGNLVFKEIDLKVEEPARPWRIAVTPPVYDDMGTLLDRLGTGYRYDTITLTGLARGDFLDHYDVVYLTCGDKHPEGEQFQINLRQFVERGGTLYASDLRYDVIAGAFPEFATTIDQQSQQRRLKLAAEIKRLQSSQAETDPAGSVQTLADALRAAGLRPTLAQKIDRIATALKDAGQAERTRPSPHNIQEALQAAGFDDITDEDLDNIAQIIRARTLEINRARSQAEKRPNQSPEQIAADVKRLWVAMFNERRHRSGAPQQVLGEIVDAGLREALGNTMELKFDAPDWMPADFEGPQVTTYMRGRYKTMAGNQAEAPLLVKFSVGEGTVIFTSFHNEKQNSNKEQILLRYLVFTAVTAKQDSSVAKTMLSGGFSSTTKSLSSHSSGSPSVTRIYSNDRLRRLRFALSFANQAARRPFEITAPSGQTYATETESTRIVDIENAPEGDWQYTVIGLRVPYENFPFSVDVGVEQP